MLSSLYCPSPRGPQWGQNIDLSEILPMLSLSALLFYILCNMQLEAKYLKIKSFYLYWFPKEEKCFIGLCMVGFVCVCVCVHVHACVPVT
jgi:hypothetical protein